MENNIPKKLYKILIAILVIILIVVIWFVVYNRDTYNPTPVQDNVTKDLIEGKKEDLISSSVRPGERLSGVINYTGAVKGGYFFEANILINILDSNKNLLRQGYATSTTEWMTAGPVSFSGTVDFTDLPKGPAYIEIHNDNASGLPENDKSILIPIIID